MTFSEAGRMLKEAASGWVEDKASRLGAALAYYAVFSLAPLLIIVIAVVGLVWGGQPGGVQAGILDEVRTTLGLDGAEIIRTMLENASRPGAGGMLATIVGVALLIFGATTVFAQLQSALNDLWGVEPDPERGLMHTVVARLLSFVMILVVGLLLLASLLLSTFLSFAGELLTGLTPAVQVLLRVASLLLSFGIVTLLFALIYRYLPDVEIAWRAVWVGAALTAALFTLGKYALSLYLGYSSTASAFGAAGSLVVLLVWIYYSAQIFFFGAKLTQVYARHRGMRIRPSKHAVWADR